MTLLMNLQKQMFIGNQRKSQVDKNRAKTIE